MERVQNRCCGSVNHSSTCVWGVCEGRGGGGYYGSVNHSSMCVGRGIMGV